MKKELFNNPIFPYLWSANNNKTFFETIGLLDNKNNLT